MSEKVEVYRYGLMVHVMKATGKIIRQTEEEDWSMQMVMFMREIGKMIRPMVMEYILMLTAQDMKESGLKISNMDLE
jgi:hypothetical protein